MPRKQTRFFAPLPVSAWPKSLLQFDFKNHENAWTDLKKNIAGRTPKTTRRRKLPKIKTKQLEHLLWSLKLHKCHEKRKNRNGIQKQIEQKLEKYVFLNSSRKDKVPLQLEQRKAGKTMGNS